MDENALKLQILSLQDIIKAEKERSKIAQQQLLALKKSGDLMRNDTEQFVRGLKFEAEVQIKALKADLAKILHEKRRELKAMREALASS